MFGILHNRPKFTLSWWRKPRFKHVSRLSKVDVDTCWPCAGELGCGWRMNSLQGGRHPWGGEVLCHNLVFLKQYARIWIRCERSNCRPWNARLLYWSTRFLYEALATCAGPYSVARLIFSSAPALIRASLAIRSVFQGLDH